MKERARAIRDAVNQVMGEKILSVASEPQYVVTYLPTTLLPFDIAMGGGIPRGRFIEINGAYSTLKSYVGLHAIAEEQRRGGVAALIDTEHSFDPAWASSLGVDITNLLIFRPETGELAIDIAEVLVRNEIGLVVFDSVAATLPQQEASKRLHKESVQPARLAALMSLAMRKLTAPNKQSSIVWINQMREQVGVTFGNPERATGGRALGYYASIRMNIRGAGKITRDKRTFTGDKDEVTKEQVGTRFKITIEKSKLDRPFTEVWFEFDMEAGGLNIVKFLFAQGVELGAITKKGNTWTGGGTNAVGKDNYLKKLKADEELQGELEEAIRSHYGLPSGFVGRPRKRAAGSKSKSLKDAVREPIQEVVRAASSTTAARKKTSSKSRTPRKFIR